MPTNTDPRSDQRDTVLDRLFSAQDRIGGSVRKAVAEGFVKVPGVQRVGTLLHQLALHQMVSRTSG